VLTWTLLGLVLLLLGVAAVLYVLLARARRRAAAADAGEPAGAAPARGPVFIPARASGSFARAVAVLRRYVPGRDARYRIPWVAVMGPSGAGSSAVAAGVDLPRPFDPPADEGAPAGDEVGWRFFEQGVLLDVPGAWVLERGGSGHDEQGWRTFLRLLERWRPDRPLDAIVLTVPADELAGPRAGGRGEVLARAEAVRERLWEAQRRLGIRVPVHVLVTRCDRVPGFGALCAELPERARHEIFGWSSPYPLEAAFSPQWVDEAFHAVHRDLYEAQVELLAGCDPRHADGVFRFPAELRRLVPGLRAYLGEVFRESAYRDALFVRGIYFTGDPRAGAERPPAPVAAPVAPEAADEDAPAVVVAPEPAHAPLFLRHLFAERVFAEAGLARAARGGARAHGPWARAAQIAAAFLVVVGLPGLLLAHRRLDATGERAARILRDATVEAEVLDREAEGRIPAGTGRVDVVRLVDAMAALPTGQLWSPAIPQSWFGGLRRTVVGAQTAVVGGAVLPVMRTRLLARADALLPTDPSMGTGGADPDSLAAYLRQVAALSEGVNRYNALSTAGTAGAEEMEALSEYLFGVRAAPHAGRARAWSRALRLAHARRISGDRTDLALQRAEGLAGEVYARLSATLAELDEPGAGGADVPGGGLDPERLGTEFAAGDSAWLSATAPLPARVDSALSAIRSSALISAPRLRDEVRARFATVRAGELSALESPGDASDPGAVPAARSLVALRDALAALRGQPFADAGSPVRLMEAVPSSSAPVAWDTAGLARALARHDAFTQFVDGPRVAGLPARSRALVRSLAAAQLEAGMSREVARSARPLALAGASPLASGAEREMRARVGALAPGAGLLARVAGAYAQAERGAAYDDLGTFAALQGGAVLSQADRLLETLYYVPRERGFAWWRGQAPVSFAAFGVRDTAGLDEYLAFQRAGVQRLYTGYAAPVLALLQADALAPFVAAPTPEAAGALERAERWAALGEALAAYEAKQPSSLARLETLIADGLGAAAPGRCAPAAAAVPGTDWFALRARGLRDAFLDRCRELSGRWVRDGYDRVRAAFNASLAGRFPFAREADAAAEADPGDVRDFLELYGRMAEVRASVRSGRDGMGGPGSRAAAFLEEMDAAAAFLAPLAAADTGAGPAYRVAAEFRASRGREAGADQVAEWAMQVGSERLTPRDPAGAAAGWSPGEPVALAFRWAAGSPVRPAAEGLAWGGQTDGTTLRFGYGGEWPLLRLLAARSANPRERGARTLAFPARTVAAPQPGHAPAAAPGDALLFVRVRVLDPATRRTLDVPRFPAAAPPLDGGGDA
jgi:type VI secretion system protein ImpL